LLVVSHLQAVRDDRVLFSDLSFTLQAGDIVQVVGANGTGKTTLLQGLMGLSTFESGEMRWCNDPISDNPRLFKQQVTFIGHLLGLKALLTPVENLHCLAQIRGQALSIEVIETALAKVGLAGYEHIAVASLSAGQKRRVALARLFLEQATLWVLDEPFTAIDQAGVVALENWLVDHAQQGGMVLLTTHHRFSADFPLRRLDLARYRPEAL